MAIRDLIPWGRARRDSFTRWDTSDFRRRLEEPGVWREGLPLDLPPRVDVRETDEAIEVIADLPGYDERDLDIGIAEGALTLRAEKQAERKVDQKEYVLRERSIGRIQRVVPLPDGLDLDSARAAFKNGTLRVTIAKTPEARATARHIPVQRDDDGLDARQGDRT
jgi:HSP20 family protein